jgi:CDP-glycerol glycerophosphotransferase (TagB/SpsB family)
MVINLWHGCGYKDRGNPLPKKKQFDFGLVPGQAFIDVKSKFWGCRKEQIIPIGYPRYDQMKNISEETKIYFAKLKRGFDKVILWMPTFRKTERNEFAASKITGYFELPLLNSAEQLHEIDNYCRKMNTLLCVKRHPKQIKYECENIGFSNIVFINNQDLDEQNADLYGLFACVDALISDYSSSAIDFLLVDKPIAFTLNDMQDYGTVQGFVFEEPLKYMPGHHIYTYEDFLGFINDINMEFDPFCDSRRAIVRETHNPCECYCERICQYFMIQGD